MRVSRFVACLILFACTACSDDDSGKNSNADQNESGKTGGGGSSGRVATGAAGKAGAPSDDEVKTTENDPMTSYIGAAGIGVSDLDRSQKFYSEVFGLALRYEYPVEGYVTERIMYFKDGTQGADVVLMHFVDGQEHNYANNPVRLVFYVPDVKATAEMIRVRGLAIVSEPHPEATFHDAIIGVGQDPDGYLIELIEDQTLKAPYLTALGIGVKDLDQAKAFYIDVLGMQASGDITKVPGVWDEWILEYPSGKGAGLVVMHYTDGADHDYGDLPVKSVHFVGDSRAMTAKVKAEGLPVVSEPQVLDLQGTKALIGLTNDHDGYAVEFLTQ